MSRLRSLNRFRYWFAQLRIKHTLHFGVYLISCGYVSLYAAIETQVGSRGE